ncbi:MAG TPA: tetratricopeptide repeat protein [Bacteroidia bacterium]|nr:tetratricopeptide repeat protein [Bacteroidia bacterium]
MVRNLIIFFLFVIPFTGISQQTQVYVADDAAYFHALDLYQKQKYVEAEEEFDRYADAHKGKYDLNAIDAQYYAAICSYELFHKDAEERLKKFLNDYPESVHAENVMFELGRYNYRKKKYKDALGWFAKIDKRDLQPDELSEYYFKCGYSHYDLNQVDSAKADFLEIKDKDTKYSPSANYYYSHMMYVEGNYETALQGFLKLSGDPAWGPVIPFYIAQIYFLQNKFQDVINYAPPLLDSAKRAAEISHLIGASYYRLNKFKDAVPYLEKYRKGALKYTRDDSYELAYAYYKSDSVTASLQYFQEAIANDSDALAQNAWYYLADAYLKTGDKQSARSAFLAASSMKFDPVIREDALFSSAKLSYELDFSPFNEAIVSLNQYLYEYPNTPRHDEAYELLTNVYLSSKNYKEALDAISKIKMLSPAMQGTYQQVAFNYGILLYQKKDYVNAVAAFDKAATYPISRELNSNAHYWKAECWYSKAFDAHDSLGYGKAITEYQLFQVTPGATILPNYNTANYNIGYSYFQEHDWSSAAIAFRKYIASKTDNDNNDHVFDAYLRMGDAYFRLKDFPNSSDFYSKAVATATTTSDYKDYALFQEAMALGYQGKESDKAAMLKKMRDDYPKSVYFIQGRYQEARTLHDMRMYDEALAAYQDVYNSAFKADPKSILVVSCLKYMGLIYQTKGDNDNALIEYKQAITMLQTSKGTDFSDVMHSIKTIYIAKGQLDQWETYAASVGYAESEATSDSTAFVVAQKFYKDGNCTDAITQADKYIARFPSGIYIVDVQYMRAECEFKNNDLPSALTSYVAILAKGTSKYNERCLAQSSYIYYKQKDYTNAAMMYGRLIRESSNADAKNVASVNLMRCWTFLGNEDSAAFYAAKAILVPKAPDDVLGEANYHLGKQAYRNLDKTGAEKKLKEVEKLIPNTEMAAEARFIQCQIMYDNKAYKTAEKAILREINDYASYSQWSGRGWLLLSDDYLALKDTFQAKNVLKIYIDNGDVPDLIQQAKDKLSALENAGKKDNGKQEEDLVVPMGNDGTNDPKTGGGQ